VTGDFWKDSGLILCDAASSGMWWYVCDAILRDVKMFITGRDAVLWDVMPFLMGCYTVSDITVCLMACYAVLWDVRLCLIWRYVLWDTTLFHMTSSLMRRDAASYEVWCYVCDVYYGMLHYLMGRDAVFRGCDALLRNMTLRRTHCCQSHVFPHEEEFRMNHKNMPISQLASLPVM
jgi:hypothetical protein